MSFKSIAKNIAKRGLKDILNERKREVYEEYKDIKKEGLLLPYDDILAYCEQVVYRTRQCGDCCQAGECKVCSCEMPAMALCPSGYCEANKWGSYMSPEEWEKYKQQMNIQIALV